MATRKVSSFAAARQKKADKWKYTASNARDAMMEHFDLFEHRVQRQTREHRADVERRNRKRI
jgi:hypothetical protein